MAEAMWLRQAVCYIETLRNLRWIQIADRIRRRLFTPRPDLRDAPPRRALPGPFALPCVKPVRVSADLARFRVLNLDRSIAGANAWNDPAAPRLWLYNLHYFEDIPPSPGDVRAPVYEAFIARWIAENPPGKGVGWEPYPISLRLVSWIKWALLGGALPDQALHSLAVQARYLAQSLEYHLLANHLWANGKALLFAGSFFEGEEARRWQATGRAILYSQLDEQFLADGGHFELSPMYHAVLTEDLLDLVNLDTLSGSAGTVFRSTTTAALRWLGVMTRRDGHIPFFNDAAHGVAESHENLCLYAARLGLSCPEIADSTQWLLPSGYVRVSHPRYQLFADVGPLGPSYNPGHGHCDMLSFEFFTNVPVVVNSGTSTYEPGPLRLHERRTAAHSTVQVGEAEQSDLWGAFRAGRRAHIVARDIGESVFEAAHDGFRKEGAIHRRRFETDPDGILITDDCGISAALARFHLHPDIVAQEREGGVIAGSAVFTFKGAESVRLVPGHYAPEFNQRLPTSVVEVRFTGRLSTRIAV
jgi:uncharacterized heparinase superfamily protein